MDSGTPLLMSGKSHFFILWITQKRCYNVLNYKNFVCSQAIHCIPSQLGKKHNI